MANYFDQFDQPSALVGRPENGMKYSPAQMAQLNAARDALRAAEVRGDADTYGGEGKQQGNYFDQFDSKPQVQAAPQQPAGIGVPPQSAPMIALGHNFDRLAAGAKQAVRGIFGDKAVDYIDRLGSNLGMADASDLESSQAANEVEYNKLRNANPAGAFLGDMATAALGGPTPVGMGVIGALEYGSPEDRAIRGASGYIGGKVGQAVAGKVANALAGKPSVNPIRDATVQEAQSAGYVIPPSQVNPESPGLVNRLAEGFAGKLQTGQQAAIKNQEVTNRLAARAVGLDGPVTADALRGVRRDAGKAYDAVAKVGTVSVDNEFGSQIGEVVGPYLQLAGQFPSQRNPAVDALLKDLMQPQMESGAVVDLVKRLRFDGFKNVKSPDPVTAQLGKVQLSAQNALEDLLDRNLAAQGNGSLLQEYRAARTLIAKAHTVENALEESTGKVVAGKIGREFAKGRPLTGDLATIGKTAEAFPKAVQNVNSSMPGLSPLDYGSGVLGGVISGNPMVAAIPLARPVIRAGLLSPLYQATLAGGKAGALPNLSPSSAKLLRDLLTNSGGLLGSSAAMSGQ